MIFFIPARLRIQSTEHHTSTREGWNCNTERSKKGADAPEVRVNLAL
ncbi:Uncharacterised protein [uncultured Comamonas sp.]|nr:Uncharacterised protein [uncultured Comamonas sp.]